jgi:GDP-4-dehydro-6-deoxy-D-mannose reductase
LRALVTGACGFAGSHLTELLVAHDYEVTAVAAPNELVENLTSNENVELVRCDLRDTTACSELIESAKPELIFHLAAISFVPEAETDPDNLLAINVGGTVALAQAALKANAKFIFISSSEVYGAAAPDLMPLTEATPIAPANLYARSKLKAETALNDLAAKGLRLTVLRPFSHIGPRQSERFAASSFAKQIVACEKDLVDPVIRVGNLEAKRDFTDVRDMVRAYKLAAELGLPGPYNLGSGKAVSIRNLLDGLLSHAKIDVSVEVDPLRLRPADVPLYQCDASAFMSASGWEPKIPLDQTLAELLDYWRNRFGDERNA